MSTAELIHGTRSAYVTCRCDECRRFNAERNRVIRSKRKWDRIEMQETGKYQGRGAALSDEIRDEIVRTFGLPYTVGQLALKFGVSKNAVYVALREGVIKAQQRCLNARPETDEILEEGEIILRAGDRTLR